MIKICQESGFGLIVHPDVPPNIFHTEYGYVPKA